MGMNANSSGLPAVSTAKFILFVQHGWADTASDLTAMAQRWLVPEQPPAYLIAPNLGWFNTWLPMEPMIQHIERMAGMAQANYPGLPWRIVAHSMGGVLWLEVLQRHPEWWSQIHSLVLIGSPVGGSHMAKMFDPFGWFPLVGRDLGRNRRALAESVASVIPTLSIVSNIGLDTDGLVALSSSWFRHAQYIELSGIRHSALRYNAQVAAVVGDFWQALPSQSYSLNESSLNTSSNNRSLSNVGNTFLSYLRLNKTLTEWKVLPELSPLAIEILGQLHELPLTDCDSTHHDKAEVWRKFTSDLVVSGLEVRVWQNSWGVIHVYLTFGGRFIYGGYAGWQDKKIIDLWLDHIKVYEVN